MLIAAERLFGAYGLEGTSMRRIGVDAGQANVSVVQYYFDSKEDLASQILDWRVSDMEAERKERLAIAMAARAGQRLYLLLEALYLPVISFVDIDGKHPFARFLTQYMTTFRTSGVTHPEDVVGRTPQLARLVRAIEQELHFLPPELVRMRSMKEMIGFLALVSSHDTNAMYFDWHPSFQEMVDDSIRTSVSAMMTSPPPVIMG